MQEFLTKCPHCTTVFKLNQSHLEAAQGIVRCGSCLEVFNANENLVAQHDSQQLSKAANGETITHEKPSSIMKDPLADSDVHWTQALSNDIDKIYQYLATELDLDNDPELAQNLKSDQWGRDLLAELDEELGAPEALTTPPPTPANSSSGQLANQPAETLSPAQPMQPIESDNKITAQSNESSIASPQSEPPPTQSEGQAQELASDTSTAQLDAEKPLPSFDDELSDVMLSLPDAQPGSAKYAKAQPSASQTEDEPSTNTFDIESAQPVADNNNLQAMDDWSAALLDDLKQTVDEAEAASPIPTPDTAAGPAAPSDTATPTAPPMDVAAQANEEPITPSFVDPVGIDSDKEDTAGGPAALNETWSNNLLAELENQSKNIAENIKQALQDQEQNSLIPEKEVSLDDLALIPLREHSDDEAAATPESARAQPNPARSKGKKAKTSPQQSELSLTDGADSFQASAPSDQANATSHNAVNLSLNSLSSEFESEMVNPGKRSRKFSWSALAACFIFGVVLAGQVAFFERDQLSKDERLRPYYTKACELIGCELPPQENFAAIRSTEFVVRVHPTESNALVVDANIKNQASFEQPFPAIELSFTDMNGKIVARRRFTPDEYRGANTKQLKLMPSQRTIRLTLAIIDPGDAAKNYELKLFKHTSNPA
jgi:predicted Zn finger-like uncharacterized protein